MVERVRAPRDRLQSAAAVNVRYGGYLPAPLRPNRKDFLHVRRRLVDLEPVADAFLEDTGGEGAESLAKLDPQIDNVAHVGAARVGQQGSAAQSAGPEFHFALEPAHYFAVEQQIGRAIEQGTLFVRLERKARIADCCGTFVARRFAAPVGMILNERARLAEQPVPDVERGAERSAVVGMPAGT